jgi:HAD superfamily hydrolase (TIGR01509 family)
MKHRFDMAMSKKNIKWIFFDNDGILVDTESLYFQANREVLGSIGIDLTKELFVQVSMQQGRSTFGLAQERGIEPATIDRLHDIRNQRYAELLSNGVHIMEGVKETLNELNANVSMGVVTSCRKVHFDLIHQQTILLNYFNFVITSEDVRHTKPDPEPYLMALEHSGCPASECLVIEDSERGLAAAKAANIDCIVIPNPLTANGNFDGALAVLENIRLILDYVKI